jgi:hypothetical protein
MARKRVGLEGCEHEGREQQGPLPETAGTQVSTRHAYELANLPPPKNKKGKAERNRVRQHRMPRLGAWAVAMVMAALVGGAAPAVADAALPSQAAWADAFAATREESPEAASELPKLAYELGELKSIKGGSPTAFNAVLQLLNRHLEAFEAKISSSKLHSARGKSSVLALVQAAEAVTQPPAKPGTALVLPPGHEGEGIPADSNLEARHTLCQRFLAGSYRYQGQFAGRPAFVSTDGVFYLYYSPSCFKWLISNDLGAPDGYAASKSFDPREHGVNEYLSIYPSLSIESGCEYIQGNFLVLVRLGTRVLPLLPVTPHWVTCAVKDVRPLQPPRRACLS